MGIITTIDDAIHTACTRFSHKLQQFCGLTNYFVARIGVGFTAICVIADVINYYYRFLPEPSSLFLVVISLLILLSCIHRSIACQHGEDKVGENVKPASVLYYTERPFWRVIWTGLAVMDTGFAFRHSPFVLSWLQLGAFSFGCALFYNFIIVNPLPPGKNKVKEWLSNFGRQPQLAPVRASK